MTTGFAQIDLPAPGARERLAGRSRLRSYFASDAGRTIQTVLGLIWLLDGGLQFQSFLYSHGFIEMLDTAAHGQPGWVASSMHWAAGTAATNLPVYNTLFALTQVAIGLGLLWRPTVKHALALSFVWALVVWWFGEGFGMLLMEAAPPLTGAPGAVVLYALIGAIVWPRERPGGLLGVNGARGAWAALWIVMAWAWLAEPSSSANATSTMISAAPSGMSWLSSLQQWAASAARGNGVPIALILAAVSATIGIAVAANWHAKRFLALAIALNAVYWGLGQGLGGIFEGGATDPNAGLLFIVLAVALASLCSVSEGELHTREDRAGSRPWAARTS